MRGVKKTRGRGRSKGKSVQQREPSPDPLPPASYGETTDPKLVTGPVLELVHPALTNAWSVNGKHKMETIFDSVNPVRQFKRDEKYDEEVDGEDAFADYDPSPESDSDVTDSDEDCDLKPYLPIVTM